MADITEIDPVAAGPVQPETAPAPPEDLLPPEIEGLPVFQAVVAGQPAAIYATADSKSPSIALLAHAAPALPQAGLGLYSNKKVGVLFNPKVISPQQIAQAVRDGSLDKIAVPIDMFEGAVAEVQGGEAAPQATPAGAAGVPAPSAKANQKINTARLKNLAPSAPTQGAKPGQGLLNDLLKPAI